MELEDLELWNKFIKKYLSEPNIVIETNNKPLSLMLMDNPNVIRVYYNKDNVMGDEACYMHRKTKCGCNSDGFMFIKYEEGNPHIIRYHHRCLTKILEKATKKLPCMYMLLTGGRIMLVDEDDEYKDHEILYSYDCEDAKKLKEIVMENFANKVCVVGKTKYLNVKNGELDKFIRFILD